MRPRKKMTHNNFFDAGSPFLAHPALTPERTRKELDNILSVLELPRGASVLDVGCGFGRHSLALAECGYQVTGVDPSAAMIQAALQRLSKVETHRAIQEPGVKAVDRPEVVQSTIPARSLIDFHQSKLEDFETDRRFDAALCLFTTLGQISISGDNRDLVPAVFDLLVPGGSFVVEVPQRDPAAAGLITQDRFGTPETFTLIKREYEPGDHTVTEVFTNVSPDKTESFRLAYRLYSRAELEAVLLEAGFSILACFGDYAGSPLTADSPSMLYFAESK